MGDFNAFFDEPFHKCDEYLVTLLADQGLVNMTDYLLPRRQYRGAGGWTWSMQRDRIQVTGRGNYILFTDRRIFSTPGYRRHVMEHTTG